MHQPPEITSAATQNTHYQQALDTLSTLVAVLDAQNRVTYINTALENHLGISRRYAIGQPFSLWLSDAPAFAQALAAQRSRLCSIRIENPPFNIVLQGDARQTTVECWPLQDPHSLAQHERWRNQAQENKTLLRSLAHEIKNPLGGIRGAAQLLQRHLGDKEQLHLTHIVIREADRLQSLVDRLLAPHRMPSTRTQFSIHEACERVRSILLAEYPSGLSILRDYDASLPELYGDREQIIQALLNIAQNAVQAMHEMVQQCSASAEPIAELRLKTRIARNVRVGATQHKLAIDLRVLDNGPGVDPSVKDRIFYPLVSARVGGSGLGLTLAQTIVQNHGGYIGFSSEPGRTEFHLLLPLQPPPLPTSA